jgi:DMSO/TMAO reductase YedYZ molybdopterin-dependent catalytic subunit
MRRLFAALFGHVGQKPVAPPAPVSAPAPFAPEATLPPGQHLVDDLPVLDIGIRPSVAPEDWTLTVDGAVESPVTWGWRDLLDQPQVEVTADIHCVTSWSVLAARWTGVSALHLMEVVRPRPTARFVMLKGEDGYSTNLPLRFFADADSLIAHSHGGAPLSVEHGGPVRMVVPRLYFWKSTKWLRSVTFMEEDAPGFWEAGGYHDVGDPWLEERYR